jgi:hypothetical protein
MKLCHVALALVVFGTTSLFGCTIFVLTDGDRVLFCNNEDWFNRATRLWFVPAGKDHLGCAYVGFDNGWAQGGVNEAGVAFDWVAGFEEKYPIDPQLKSIRGNPSERMLESCATIDEAIAFYRTHLEADFRRGRIMIADRTGASVIIGARDGKLHFDRQQHSRGFGWARDQLRAELAKSPEPTLAACGAILRACLQPGDGGTKYSNVFDLKSGDIVLFPDPRRDEPVTLNLASELAKGGHVYELARIREQMAAAPRPLPNNMRRFVLDEYPPIPDSEPETTARVRRLIEEAVAGTMRENDYARPFWTKAVAGAEKRIQADLQRYGPLESLAVVERRADSQRRSYRYVFEFTKARVLGRYEIDADGKVALFQPEAVELKPAF